jgi:hypothetical protein
MPAADLEQFLAENRGVLRLTHQDCLVHRLRRRRRSVERQRDSLRIPTAHLGGMQRLRVLVVGDDTKSKLQLVRMTVEAAPGPGIQDDASSGVEGGGRLSQPRRHAAVLEVQSVVSCPSRSPAGGEQHRPTVCEVFVPDAGAASEGLRGELYAAAECVIVLYSIRDRRSFDAVRTTWAAEIQSFRGNPPHSNRNAQQQMLLGEQWRRLPIVLVGTDAEVRTVSVGQHAVAVTTQEAVHAAHEIGASKYVEVAAANVGHARSVLEQAVAAAQLGSRTPQQQRDAALGGLAVKELLHSEDPATVFDLPSRVLAVQQPSDPGAAAILMTIDGTDPLVSGSALLVTTPTVELPKPAPKVVRLAQIARCMYPSRVVDVVLPEELPCTRAYVDVALRQLVVQTERFHHSAATVRFTVDGSDPTESSPELTQRMALEGGGLAPKPVTGDAPPPVPLQAWQGPCLPYRAVKFATFSSTRFRSRVQTIEVPEPLETPKASFGADGTLVVHDAQPHLEYRYTLDGTVPSYYTGTPYLRPVLISREQPGLKQIRIAAFPRLVLPSRECIVEVARPPAAVVHHRDPAARSIGTTRTVMHRTEAAMAKRQDSSAQDGHHMLVAPGSRRAESIVRTRSRSPAGPAAAAAPALHPPPQIRALGERPGATPPQRRVAKSNAAPLAPGTSQTPPRSPAAAGAPQHQQHQQQQQQHQQQQKVNRGTAASPRGKKATPSVDGVVGGRQSEAPKCRAEDNVVSFDFPQPILLSHITVATPGSQGGPSQYEIHAQHQLASGFVVVGDGELADVDGVQTMNIIASAKSLPIVKVKCVFLVEDGQRAFFVHDMKVHGKPFKQD